MIAIIDNHDSFVHNLARQLRLLGQTTVVIRNDATDPAGILALRPQAIVISPGPCHPQQAGLSVPLVIAALGRIPVLGVCLGHQAICAALGGNVMASGKPVHGRASPIEHAGDGLFAGLPNPMTAGRYHSLVADRKSLPHGLQVTAWTADGTVMAVQHRSEAVAGVQFHPESILTGNGPELLANFLRQAGLPVRRTRVQELQLPGGGTRSGSAVGTVESAGQRDPP